MSTTLLHTLLQVSGSGGPRMRAESSSQPLIRVQRPLPAPSPSLGPSRLSAGSPEAGMCLVWEEE